MISIILVNGIEELLSKAFTTLNFSQSILHKNLNHRFSHFTPIRALQAHHMAPIHQSDPSSSQVSWLALQSYELPLTDLCI